MLTAPSEDDLKVYRQQAKKNCVKKLLQALLRENLLSSTQNGNQIKIPLHRNNAHLNTTATLHSLSRYDFPDNIDLVTQHNQKLESIKDPMELLTLIQHELEDSINSTLWQSFVAEIKNHTENAALSYWASN